MMPTDTAGVRGHRGPHVLSVGNCVHLLQYDMKTLHNCDRDLVVTV